MSHVEKTTCPIDDLDSLAAAVAHLGATFVRGQKTYAWWGRSVGDYPLPEGMTEADLGKCSHAIRIPGCEWEVGVVESKTKKGQYHLMYDFFGHRGDQIHKVLGDKLGSLQQRYALERTKRKLKRKGINARFNKAGNVLHVQEKRFQ